MADNTKRHNEKLIGPLGKRDRASALMRRYTNQHEERLTWGIPVRLKK